MTHPKILLRQASATIFAALLPCLGGHAQERCQAFNLETLPKREVRAVWLTTLSNLDWPKGYATTQEGIERQKRQLTEILDRYAEANINTVLFQARVRATTTGADILILSLLMVQCALGLLTIPFSAQHMDGSEMMKLVGWAQSVVTFHGGASQHLDGVAFIFRVHLVLGMTLFLLFPFSRLVHIWSAPVEYLTRKYQIVRARR